MLRFGIVTSFICLFNIKIRGALFIILSLTFLVLFCWWRDVSRERFGLGGHTKKVIKGLRVGMVLFIASEVLFFFGFFWRFFHSALRPVPEIGLAWPPKGIEPVYPFGVPLLNTLVLLRSGVSVTWRHHRILIKNYLERVQRLIITLFLGVYFTFLQGIEYYRCSFTLADRVYGSVFFVATGFHGTHVLIGSIFLAVMLSRLFRFEFREQHHTGFELAAWYWHFVDVVWIFLFRCIYWWGR